MPSYAQQLKDDDSKTEVIVVRSPYDRAVVGNALHLGRLMRADADRAKPDSAIARNLETVAVDQANCTVLGDDEIAVIDVTDDQAGPVHGREGPGCIGRGVDEKPPVCAGKLLKTKLRACPRSSCC